MKNLFTLFIYLLCSSAALAQTQFINDESFEQSGAGANVWEDTNYTQPGWPPIEKFETAHTGDYYVGLYKYANEGADITVSQVFVNLSKRYNCRLEFYIKCFNASGSSADLLGISFRNGALDTALFVTTGLLTDSASLGGGWKKISINIDSMEAGYGEILIATQSLTASPEVNFYAIDDLTLTTGYPTPIAEQCADNCAPTIFPTATTGHITVQSRNTVLDGAQVMVCDAMGRLVLQQKLYGQQQQLDLSNLQAGIYQVIVANASKAIIAQGKVQKL
ncbi:MAG: Secretion system C-terminal sorting domain [Bacteroidota bacterium]|jgi:hypothetical protein